MVGKMLASLVDKKVYTQALLDYDRRSIVLNFEDEEERKRKEALIKARRCRGRGRGGRGRGRNLMHDTHASVDHEADSLSPKPRLRAYIHLRKIQSVTVLKQPEPLSRNPYDAHCDFVMGIRLRAPPHLVKIVVETNCSGHRSRSTVMTACDPTESSMCAFGCPTAFFCLHFLGKTPFTQAADFLYGFLINLKDDPVVLAPPLPFMKGHAKSRHECVRGGQLVSHRLPPGTIRNSAQNAQNPNSASKPNPAKFQSQAKNQVSSLESNTDTNKRRKGGMHAVRLSPLSSEMLAETEDEEFCVLYALEVLLCHGNMRSTDIHKLLEKLVELWQWRKIRSFSAELDALC